MKGKRVNLKKRFDQETQCELISMKFSPFVASLLRSDKIETHHEVQSASNSKAVQVVKENSDNYTDLLIQEFVTEILKMTITNQELKSFVYFLTRLRDETLSAVRSYCFKELLNQFKTFTSFTEYQFRVFEMLLLKERVKFDEKKSFYLKKFSKNENFDKVNMNLTSLDLSKLISLTLEKSSRKNERRKLAVEKFRKLINVVRANRKWLKTLNNNKRNQDLLKSYKGLELEDQLRNVSKKGFLLFDKDHYKAEKSFFKLTGLHRKIFSRPSNLRTHEEMELLDKLIINIPKLSGFSKHIRKHITKLMNLIVYEKGREIVREGHEAIGFYLIITGGCDVIFSDTEGMLKIEELQIGETFGSNSFIKNGKTNNTIITNQNTELIRVIPDEIESFIQSLRKIEIDEIKTFISNWSPLTYWNWTLDNFNQFIENSVYLRFTKCDIIYGNQKQVSNTLFIILKGHVDVLRHITIPTGSMSKKKYFKICTLVEKNYFGLTDENSIDTWYIAQNDVNIVTINKENFKKIHPYADFLLVKLTEDLKFWLPTIEQELQLEREIVEWEKFVKKVIKNY